MSDMITARMFLAGLLLRIEGHELDFESLYNYFCIEYSSHSTEVISAKEIYKELGKNDDQWFEFKPSPDAVPKTVDMKCEVRLVSDLRILDAMRFKFEQLFWVCDNKISRDVVYFLCEAKCTLAEMTASLRLPKFQDAFRFIISRDLEPKMNMFASSSESSESSE